MNITAIFRTRAGKIDRKSFFDLYSMKEFLFDNGCSLVRYETKPLSFGF